jgi:hypothetical protein
MEMVEAVVMAVVVMLLVVVVVEETVMAVSDGSDGNEGRVSVAVMAGEEELGVVVVVMVWW